MVLDPPEERSPDGSTAVVWGADVGGTSCRVAVSTAAGRIVARAVAGSGNPTAVGVPGSARQISRCRDAALHRAAQMLGPVHVVGSAVGLAGFGTIDPPSYVTLLGPGPAPRLVPDPVVGFSSATNAPRGIVVLAGTGAVAMEVAVDDWAVSPDGIVRRRDGWGWLLGDAGSATWLGREAVRHTLAQLEDADRPLPSGAPRPRSPLAESVLATWGAATIGDLLQAAYAHPPTELGALAPLVSAAAAHDPADAAILERAAGHPAAAADRLLTGTTADGPIVLAGALLGPDGPLNAPVTARLRTSANPVLTARDGTVGACWIALPDRSRTRFVHDRLAASDRAVEQVTTE